MRWKNSPRIKFNRVKRGFTVKNIRVKKTLPPLNLMRGTCLDRLLPSIRFSDEFSWYEFKGVFSVQNLNTISLCKIEKQTMSKNWLKPKQMSDLKNVFSQLKLNKFEVIKLTDCWFVKKTIFSILFSTEKVPCFHKSDFLFSPFF